MGVHVITPSTLSDYPIEELIEELGNRFSEMVIVGRVRPAVLGPNCAPTVMTAGTGDHADQFGLLAIAKMHVKAGMFHQNAPPEGNGRT
jgi:hypothetical protein